MSKMIGKNLRARLERDSSAIEATKERLVREHRELLLGRKEPQEDHQDGRRPEP